MNGIRFEEAIVDLLQNSLSKKFKVERGKKGIDIIVRIQGENKRFYIECKLNKRAITGQVTLKIMDGKIVGLSERSHASSDLKSHIIRILEENKLIGVLIDDAVNTSYKTNENLGKINHICRMNENKTPGKPTPKQYIIIGQYMYKLKDFDPGETRIRIRRKGSRFVVVVESINGIDENSDNNLIRNVARELFK